MSFIAEDIVPDEDWQAYRKLSQQLAEARNAALEEAAVVAERASEHYVSMSIEALKTPTTGEDT
jgi:hypothetical protein